MNKRTDPDGVVRQTRILAWSVPGKLASWGGHRLYTEAPKRIAGLLGGGHTQAKDVRLSPPEALIVSCGVNDDRSERSQSEVD